MFCLTPEAAKSKLSPSRGDEDVTVAQLIATNPKAGFPMDAQEATWLSYTSDFLVALWFAFAK